MFLQATSAFHQAISVLQAIILLQLITVVNMTSTKNRWQSSNLGDVKARLEYNCEIDTRVLHYWDATARLRYAVLFVPRYRYVRVAVLVQSCWLCTDGMSIQVVDIRIVVMQ